MAIVATNNANYTNIANAIRNKNGKSDTYTPAEMVQAINELNVSGVINLQEKSVNPTESTQTVTADSSYDGLSSVTVSAIQTETKTTNVNGDVVPSTGKYLKKVTVSVPTGSTIKNQNKSVNPTESEQEVTYDVDANNYTGLGTVTVGAISSTYVGSSIPTRTSANVTYSSGYTNVAGGYYSSDVSKIIPVGTLNLSASKGTVSSHSITVTPSATITAGYISSVNNTSSVSVSASELVSGKKEITSNGDNIDVTNYASVKVAVPTGSTINNQDKTVAPSTSEQEVTFDDGYTGLGTVTVSAMPTLTLPTSTSASATSGYTSKATVSRSTSDQYINIGTGYNTAGAYYKISAVANGSATNSGSISGTSATITTGTNTITLSKSVSITPTVSAGYVSSGTAGNVTVSLTGSVTTKAAATITPTTTDQTISSGTYLTGAQTISGDADLVAGNIKSGVTIFGVQGTYTGAGSTIGSLTVTPTESEQTFNSSSVDGYKPVVVEAISSTYVGSGITRGDSTSLSASGATVSVPAGYYAEAASKSVDSMTLPTSASSSATSGYTSKATISRSTSDQYINIPTGYNSAGAYYKVSAVANGSATGPSSLSGSSATITTGTNTITLTKTGVTTTPTVSAGYVSSATASTATVALTASVTVNPTPTASGKTVTIPAGYYSSQTTKDVSTGSATAPASISGTTATVSTGTNTLTLTKTVSVTPSVTAGYIASGTAGNSSVSLTASVTTKAAATITPGTTDQTIASGTYLTGTQTISGDADLVATNIISTANIFGVQGSVVINKYYTGSSTPSSTLGSNGDIYLKS